MKFGVAGVPTNYKGKFKDLFNWLREMGLNAYEIQCVYGFKISDVNKEIIKKEQLNNMHFSIHAPYYVNLGSLNTPSVEKSKEYMKQGIELAKSVGVNRIIFHPGGGHQNTEEGRKIAVKQLIDAINEFTSEVDMGDVRLYPEIGGKTANLGSLDEIIEICQNCEYCYPCIDIAHLHARELGSIQTIEDLRNRLQKLKSELLEKFKYIHFHAYTINYNDKGEIKHLMHGENMPNGDEGKPNLDDFVALLHEMKIDPWVISEASDTQEIGAKYMHDLYCK
ncbi:MAG: TIM barrel protein [Clostridia bacterium]|nr:TIM barrel protein [Clostridia bacterium]